LLIALGVVLAGYLVADYRLITQVVLHRGFQSHRAEFGADTVAFSRGLIRAAWEFSGGEATAPSAQYPAILLAACLGLAAGLVQVRRQSHCRGGEEVLGEPGRPTAQRDLMLLCLLALTCAAIAAWFALHILPLVQSLLHASGIGALRMLQLYRVTWFQPCLWAIIFALSLAFIARIRRVGMLLAAGLIGLQLFVTVSTDQHERQEQKLTYAEFFSPQLFAEIRAFIGKPAEKYRVAGLGMHPAIALYNGFFTVDGYWVNYPLDYKHKFRRVIAGELDKSPALADYFDHWGSRCYLFSAELGQEYLFTKTGVTRRISRLDIDVHALAQLGGRYILSAVEIGNANALGLALEKVFERNDSPWRIYLYRVPEPQETRSTSHRP
jgi:hypothetical protein